MKFACFTIFDENIVPYLFVVNCPEPVDAWKGQYKNRK